MAVTKEKHREHVRKYRQSQKAAGLCIECPAPAVPGRVRCQHHLEAALAAYHSLRAAGRLRHRTP